MSEGMFFFNSLHQPHQVAAILIIEEENIHTRVDQIIRVPPANMNTALYESLYRNDNAEMLFQEMRLGIITNFINH